MLNSPAGPYRLTLRPCRHLLVGCRQCLPLLACRQRRLGPVTVRWRQSITSSVWHYGWSRVAASCERQWHAWVGAAGKCWALLLYLVGFWWGPCTQPDATRALVIRLGPVLYPWFVLMPCCIGNGLRCLLMSLNQTSWHTLRVVKHMAWQ
jgi:hypothetical protein